MANTDFGILLKTMLDKSGINTELEQVQKIVNKYSVAIMPELQTASLRNQMKAVSQEIANDFNKAFGTNLTGNDVFKAFENQAKQAEKVIKDQAKAAEQARKEQEALNDRIRKGQELAKKQANDAFVSKQSSIYGEIIKNQEQIYALKKKLLSADELETEEINKQIHSLEVKNKYNRDYKLANNGMIDSSWDKIVQESNETLENQYRLTEARKVDGAIAKEIAAEEKERAKALEFTRKESEKLDSAIQKYSYGDSSSANDMMKQLNRGVGNFSDLSSVDKEITTISSNVDKIIDDLKRSHEQSLKALNSAISAEEKATKQIQPSIDNGAYSTQIDKLVSQFQKYGLSVDEAEEKVKELRTTLLSMETSPSNESLVADYQKWEQQIKDVNVQLDKAKLKSEQIAKVNKIQLSMSTGGYESKVDSLIGKTQQWVDANGNARISTDALQTAMNNLNTAYANINASGGNTVANQQALIEAERQLDVEVKKVQSSVTSMNATMAKSSAVDSLRQKVQQFYDINTKSHRTYGAQLQNIMSQLASGTEVPIVKLRQLSQEFIGIQNSARQAGKLGLSFFDTLKQGMSKFSYWTSSTFIIMKTVQEIKEAITFTKELDSALTNINYTMNVTSSQLTDIANASIDMAKDLKTSASNILEAVTLYANAKETADSILQKSQTAIMLSNVTGMSGSESAKMLQSVMNQFDLTQDDLTYISDTIQSVSQNMAYDFAGGIEEISSGIERSGSVAKSAGLDLAEYASMLGLVIEKTGQSGDTIGNAYKTIFQRITKASATEGTLEEDISAAEKSLRAVGVEVRDSADSFRDLTDIMKDLGSVWDSLSDVEQSNISYNVAGIRQTNILKTLLGYWTDYESLVTKASDSAGTTLENQAKYEETLDAKTKKLSTTMESFWHNLIGADETNGALSVLQQIANVLEGISKTFGSLGTIGLGAGLFAGIKNVGATNYISCRQNCVLF